MYTGRYLSLLPATWPPFITSPYSSY